jgi:hypothetical protein
VRDEKASDRPAHVQQPTYRTAHIGGFLCNSVVVKQEVEPTDGARE